MFVSVGFLVRPSCVVPVPPRLVAFWLVAFSLGGGVPLAAFSAFLSWVGWGFSCLLLHLASALASRLGFKARWQYPARNGPGPFGSAFPGVSLHPSPAGSRERYARECRPLG